MRTLFWKIFLSFWAVVVASIVGSFFVRPEVPLPAWQHLVSDAFAIQGQNLVQAYEEGGEPDIFGAMSSAFSCSSLTLANSRSAAGTFPIARYKRARR